MKGLLPVLALLLLLFGGRSAQAQPVTQLTVSGSPAPMIITTAVAGSEPTPIVNSATTYYLRAKRPSGTQRIMASINAPMPFGTTLTIELGIPFGAISSGPVALSVIDQDLLANVEKVNGNTYTITYTFSATAAAGVVPSQSRTVTLTMVDVP